MNPPIDSPKGQMCHNSGWLEMWDFGNKFKSSKSLPSTAFMNA